MLKYNEVPKAIDMAPYADWYKEQVQKLFSVYSDQVDPFHVVELGSRFGCSARIFLDALSGFAGKWRLTLVDIVKKDSLKELLDIPGVTFHEAKAEDVAPFFDTRSIHVLHIDLDPHTEDQTRSILRLYVGKVAVGGVIIFHDASDEFGVKTVVEKLPDKSWNLVWCNPAPESPLSVPVAAFKKGTKTHG